MITQAQLEAKIVEEVVKDLLKRGYRVQALARRYLDGEGGHPRRIDTGDLRSSVLVHATEHNGEPAVRIGSNRRKAVWVHEGTGIYGPRGVRIVPKTRKALAFSGKRYGKGRIVVRSVKGMRPNHFLADALVAARGT